MDQLTKSSGKFIVPITEADGTKKKVLCEISRKVQCTVTFVVDGIEVSTNTNFLRAWKDKDSTKKRLEIQQKSRPSNVEEAIPPEKRDDSELSILHVIENLNPEDVIALEGNREPKEIFHVWLIEDEEDFDEEE